MNLYLNIPILIFNVAYASFGVACAIETKACLGKDYENLLYESMLPLLIFLLKMTGYLLLLVAIVGSAGVCYGERAVIHVYTAGLALALVFMLSSGWKAFLYLAKVDDILDQNVDTTMRTIYGYPGHSEWTESINYMQKEMKCCGYTGAVDWLGTSYFTDTDPSVLGDRGDLVVPRSCCIDISSPDCGTDLTASTINMNGCKAPLRILFRETLITIGYICSGVSLLLVLNILIVFCMLSRTDEKVHPYGVFNG